MKRKVSLKEYELPLEIWSENGVYLAKCISWDACYAEGYSIDEVIKEVTLVANTLIEMYREKDLQIPLKVKKSDANSDNFYVNLSIPVL